MSDSADDLNQLDGMLAEFDNDQDDEIPGYATTIPNIQRARRGGGTLQRGGGRGGKGGRRGKRIESVVLDVAFMSEEEAIREEVCVDDDGCACCCSLLLFVGGRSCSIVARSSTFGS